MAAKRQRYRGNLKRSRGRGRKPVTQTEYTYAASPDQARRFFGKRFPGFSITSVRADPASPNPRRKVGDIPASAGQVFGYPVYIEYVHEGDGRVYYHEFGGGVEMQALPDGSLRLFDPRRKLWRDYKP